MIELYNAVSINQILLLVVVLSYLLAISYMVWGVGKGFYLVGGSITVATGLLVVVMVNKVYLYETGQVPLYREAVGELSNDTE